MPSSASPSLAADARQLYDIIKQYGDGTDSGQLSKLSELYERYDGRPFPHDILTTCQRFDDLFEVEAGPSGTPGDYIIYLLEQPNDTTPPTGGMMAHEVKAISSVASFSSSLPPTPIAAPTVTTSMGAPTETKSPASTVSTTPSPPPSLPTPSVVVNDTKSLGVSIAIEDQHLVAQLCRAINRGSVQLYQLIPVCRRGGADALMRLLTKYHDIFEIRRVKRHDEVAMKPSSLSLSLSSSIAANDGMTMAEMTIVANGLVNALMEAKDHTLGMNYLVPMYTRFAPPDAPTKGGLLNVLRRHPHMFHMNSDNTVTLILDSLSSAASSSSIMASLSTAAHNKRTVAMNQAVDMLIELLRVSPNNQLSVDDAARKMSARRSLLVDCGGWVNVYSHERFIVTPLLVTNSSSDSTRMISLAPVPSDVEQLIIRDIREGIYTTDDHMLLSHEVMAIYRHHVKGEDGFPPSMTGMRLFLEQFNHLFRITVTHEMEFEVTLQPVLHVRQVSMTRAVVLLTQLVKNAPHERMNLSDARSEMDRHYKQIMIDTGGTWQELYTQPQFALIQVRDPVTDSYPAITLAPSSSSATPSVTTAIASPIPSIAPKTGVSSSSSSSFAPSTDTKSPAASTSPNPIGATVTTETKTTGMGITIQLSASTSSSSSLSSQLQPNAKANASGKVSTVPVIVHVNGRPVISIAGTPTKSSSSSSSQPLLKLVPMSALDRVVAMVTKLINEHGGEINSGTAASKIGSNSTTNQQLIRNAGGWAKVVADPRLVVRTTNGVSVLSLPVVPPHGHGGHGDFPPLPAKVATIIAPPGGVALIPAALPTTATAGARPPSAWPAPVQHRIVINAPPPTVIMPSSSSPTTATAPVHLGPAQHSSLLSPSSSSSATANPSMVTLAWLAPTVTPIEPLTGDVLLEHRIRMLLAHGDDMDISPLCQLYIDTYGEKFPKSMAAFVRARPTVFQRVAPSEQGGRWKLIKPSSSSSSFAITHPVPATVSSSSLSATASSSSLTVVSSPGDSPATSSSSSASTPTTPAEATTTTATPPVVSSSSSSLPVVENKSQPASSTNSVVVPVVASSVMKAAAFSSIVTVWKRILTATPNQTLLASLLVRLTVRELKSSLLPADVMEVVHRFANTFVYAGYGDTRVVTLINDGEDKAHATSRAHTASRAATTRENALAAADMVETMIRASASRSCKLDDIGDDVRAALPDSPLIATVVDVYQDRFTRRNGKIGMRASYQSQLPPLSAKRPHEDAGDDEHDGKEEKRDDDADDDESVSVAEQHMIDEIFTVMEESKSKMVASHDLEVIYRRHFPSGAAGALTSVLDKYSHLFHVHRSDAGSLAISFNDNDSSSSSPPSLVSTGVETKALVVDVPTSDEQTIINDLRQQIEDSDNQILMSTSVGKIYHQYIPEPRTGAVTKFLERFKHIFRMRKIGDDGEFALTLTPSSTDEQVVVDRIRHAIESHPNRRLTSSSVGPLYRRSKDEAPVAGGLIKFLDRFKHIFHRQPFGDNGDFELTLITTPSAAKPSSSSSSSVSSSESKVRSVSAQSMKDAVNLAKILTDAGGTDNIGQVGASFSKKSNRRVKDVIDEFPDCFEQVFLTQRHDNWSVRLLRQPTFDVAPMPLIESKSSAPASASSSSLVKTPEQRIVDGICEAIQNSASKSESSHNLGHIYRRFAVNQSHHGGLSRVLKKYSHLFDIEHIGKGGDFVVSMKPSANISVPSLPSLSSSPILREASIRSSSPPSSLDRAVAILTQMINDAPNGEINIGTAGPAMVRYHKQLLTDAGGWHAVYHHPSFVARQSSSTTILSLAVKKVAPPSVPAVVPVPSSSSMDSIITQIIQLINDNGGEMNSGTVADRIYKANVNNKQIIDGLGGWQTIVNDTRLHVRHVPGNPILSVAKRAIPSSSATRSALERIVEVLARIIVDNGGEINQGTAGSLIGANDGHHRLMKEVGGWNKILQHPRFVVDRSYREPVLSLSPTYSSSSPRVSVSAPTATVSSVSVPTPTVVTLATMTASDWTRLNGLWVQVLSTSPDRTLFAPLLLQLTRDQLHINLARDEVVDVVSRYMDKYVYHGYEEERVVTLIDYDQEYDDDGNKDKPGRIALRLAAKISRSVTNNIALARRHGYTHASSSSSSSISSSSSSASDIERNIIIAFRDAIESSNTQSSTSHDLGQIYRHYRADAPMGGLTKFLDKHSDIFHVQPRGVTGDYIVTLTAAKPVIPSSESEMKRIYPVLMDALTKADGSLPSVLLSVVYGTVATPSSPSLFETLKRFPNVFVIQYDGNGGDTFTASLRQRNDRGAVITEGTKSLMVSSSSSSSMSIAAHLPSTSSVVTLSSEGLLVPSAPHVAASVPAVESAAPPHPIERAPSPLVVPSSSQPSTIVIVPSVAAEQKDDDDDKDNQDGDLRVSVQGEGDGDQDDNDNGDDEKGEGEEDGESDEGEGEDDQPHDDDDKGDKDGDAVDDDNGEGDEGDDGHGDDKDGQGQGNNNNEQKGGDESKLPIGEQPDNKDAASPPLPVPVVPPIPSAVDSVGNNRTLTTPGTLIHEATPTARVVIPDSFVLASSSSSAASSIVIVPSSASSVASSSSSSVASIVIPQPTPALPHHYPRAALLSQPSVPYHSRPSHVNEHKGVTPHVHGYSHNSFSSSDMKRSNDPSSITSGGAHQHQQWYHNGMPMCARHVLLRNQLLDEFTVDLLQYLPDDVMKTVLQSCADPTVNGHRITEIHFTDGQPPALILSNDACIHLHIPTTVPQVLQRMYRKLYPDGPELKVALGDHEQDNEYSEEGQPGGGGGGVKATIVHRLFGRTDHRLAIGLHRVSAMMHGHAITGLTFRIGRHWDTAATMITDVLQRVADKNNNCNVLLLGPPNVGKTTLLRDVSRVLATDHRLFGRAVVVDTSMEIAGPARVNHTCVGNARRMAVPSRDVQHKLIAEVCMNHSPRVIIIDELGTPAEIETVRSVAERGVSLVAAGHGRNFQSLMNSSSLMALVGGGRVFQVLIEVISPIEIRIYHDLRAAIEQQMVTCERRWVRATDGAIMTDSLPMSSY